VIGPNKLWICTRKGCGVAQSSRLEVKRAGERLRRELDIAEESSLLAAADQYVREQIHASTFATMMDKPSFDEIAPGSSQMLQLLSIGPDGARLRCRHPALTLGWVPTSMLHLLPEDSGIYVQIAPASGLAYVGESTNIRQRVPRSLRRLPFALQVVYALPMSPLTWDTAERLSLEASLINRFVFARANANHGRLGALEPARAELILVTANVIEKVVRGLMPINPNGKEAPVNQGQRVREIVMSTRDAPLTIAALREHLQACGHPLDGATIGKTLRRDLRDSKRGGSQHIKISGPWSDPNSLIYVSGRRYASGWQKT
jgi:hypothetical protein